jgi:DNA-binding winged helix-turn-helix (wHTH) protein/tetratricopeptide (TPR) repeat protein
MSDNVRRVELQYSGAQNVQADTPEKAPSSSKTIYRFADFEVRPTSGELFRNDVKVRVQEQSLQILLALIDTPGTVVTREQLCERLWPQGTYVDFEHSLNAAVKRLRAALEDDAVKPRYIETLPRRGYRLMVEVISGDSTVTPTPHTQVQPIADATAGKSRVRTVVMTVVALGLVSTAIVAVMALRSRRATMAPYGTNATRETPTPPQSGEAYELYLRSLAYKAEAPANGQAIPLLERSTALDPTSARYWYELGRRYHLEFANAGKGQGYFEKAREANRHALEIDPNYSPAQTRQVVLDAESGQLTAAFRAATDMTRARPQDADAHFALSYALRYGGMFEESAAECEAALKLDPSNTALRSCGLVYVLLGRSDRALPYLDLDSLSTYVRFRRMEIAILANDKTTALEMARSIRVGPHDYPDARLVETVLSGAPPQTVRDRSRETEALSDRINVPEAHFIEARYLAWTGHTDAALRLLRRAIANNYCSYPVMDTDPLLANVRRLPEYKELRHSGVECRDKFRAQMKSLQ